MARPHIEFVQSQVIPFERGLYGGARPDILCRTLSRDDDTGAASTVLRYSAGWHEPKAHALEADEEIFILEGSLTINGQIYGKHFYGHLPKGYARKEMSSLNGAVVLTFFSGLPVAQFKQTSDWDRRRVVEGLTPARCQAPRGNAST